jgi:integrase/recombinase XerD
MALGNGDPIWQAHSQGDLGIDELSDLHATNRHVLRRLLKRIGDRVGVKNVHPRRLRHSFAPEYLRNGGKMLALQQLLGHSDIEMVKRYAQIAQSDCANVHRKASPADNWRL